MLLILTRPDVLNYAFVTTGYASPIRKFAAVALSGFYLAGGGWWAGSRIAAAWRQRGEAGSDPRDQML